MAALALLVGVALAKPTPSALDDPAYTFCHDPSQVPEDARDWCELLDGLPRDRCPALREACESGTFGVRPQAGCNQDRPEQSEGQPADRLAAEPERPPQRDPFEGCDYDADTLQALARWMMAFFVAALVLVLVRAFWATFGGRRSREPEPEPQLVEEEDDAAEALPDVPDLPSDDLLAAARRALAEGRLGEAAMLARGASLRHLGKAARLKLHRSRTDREYVRSLKADPELQGDLRTVVRAVERHKWGGNPLTPGVASEALAAAQRLLQVVAAVWLGFALLGASAAHAQSYERYALYGDAALLTVLENHGYDAGWRLRSLLDLDDKVDALVLDLTFVSPTDAQWDHLREWTRSGHVLVVAGDASRWIEPLGTRDTLMSYGVTELRAPLAGLGLPTPRWPDGAVYAFNGGEPWVAATHDGVFAGGVVSVVDYGEGVVVGIADPRLLWNGAFVDPPDLLVLGKSLGGGLVPISCVIGRQDILDSPIYGVESETFAGMPVACSVALRTLGLLQEDGWFEQGLGIAQELRSALSSLFLATGVPALVDGRAVCCTVEFQVGATATAQAQQSASVFAKRCAEQHLRVQQSGPKRTRVVLLPPLTMSPAELEQALLRLRAAVDGWQQAIPRTRKET